MSRQLKRQPPKPPTPKPQKSPHLAANLPDAPKDLFNHCTASWNGLLPLTAAGAVFAGIVPTPATIAANLKAVGDALPLAEAGDAIPVANLRTAADDPRDVGAGHEVLRERPAQGAPRGHPGHPGPESR